MRRILALSLAQPLAVLGLAVAFAIAGAIAFWHLPIEAFPELADPQVQVITLFPGHAAEEVERLITVPVETEMNGLPRLDVARSISLYGLSDVRLVFQDFECPVYPQCWPGPFVPNLSVIDLLFNCGPDSLKVLTRDRTA